MAQARRMLDANLPPQGKTGAVWNNVWSTVYPYDNRPQPVDHLQRGRVAGRRGASRVVGAVHLHRDAGAMCPVGPKGPNGRAAMPDRTLTMENFNAHSECSRNMA